MDIIKEVFAERESDIRSILEEMGIDSSSISFEFTALYPNTVRQIVREGDVQVVNENYSPSYEIRGEYEWVEWIKSAELRDKMMEVVTNVAMYITNLEERDQLM